MFRLLIAFALCLSFATQVRGAQQETLGYLESNRLMIRNGVQALLMCNGLFTSQRTLEQVFGQELAYL